MNQRLRIVPFALASAIALSACGGATYQLAGTQQFISMDAEVEIEEGGGSYDVMLTLKFLPPPNRVAENLRHYVVWFAPEGGQPTRVAVVDYDDSDREGTAHATFPDPRFTVLITAEASTNPAVPSEHHVLEQAVRAE